MRLTYRLPLEPRIELAATPTTEHINGVTVIWEASTDRLTGVSFIVSGVTLDKSARGELLLYNPAVASKVFAAARFVADRIRLQAGYDALDPYAIVGNSPQEFVGESAEEEVFLHQHVHQHQRTTRASVALSRPFDPHVVADFERVAVPAGHYARGLRTPDPLEKYEDYFKALEYFAARRPKDDPTRDAFDHQLSEVTALVDPRFDQAKIKQYRDLRRRIVHTRTTHHLGHIGPNDLEGIRQVRVELPDIERLVWELLMQPPRFPR